MDKLEKLRNLLAETEANKDLPTEKEVLVQLMKTLIRGDELIYRSDEYFKEGYPLGYFLIESQRIEKSLADLIKTAEKLRAKSLKVDEKDIDIDIPLGALIGELKKYIKGDSIFKPLTEFNLYRRSTVHRLAKDFSKSLAEIEQSISTDYPPEKTFELQKILFEVTAKLNIKLAEHMEGTMDAKNIIETLANTLQKEMGFSELDFEILVSEE